MINQARRLAPPVLLLSLAIFAAGLVGAAATATAADGKIIGFFDYGAVDGDALWPRRSIKVCWENLDASKPSDRKLVRDAVRGSWQKHSQLRFSGWLECGDKSRGIRIDVIDTGPHVKELGRYIDGVEGAMVLNFTFKNWTTDCQYARRACLKMLAIHEFGHAIGFAHEQNRVDTPVECQKEPQGSDPNRMVTSYDLHSVMNYCNPDWLGNGKLSKLDIKSVQILYGKP